MNYLGSKRRYKKHILPIIKALRLPGQIYVEPFLGGGSIFECLKNPRLGSDVHPYLIALLQACRDGWEPPRAVSREQYYLVKKEPEKYPDHLVGFIGFLCSFGNKWWGGYARNSEGRNYALKGYNNILKCSPLLQGSEIICSGYENLKMPETSLVYCDPPYRGTTKYKDSIDYTYYESWVSELSQAGCTVFCSEYEMSDSFECILEIPTNITVNKNKKECRIEKLFTPRKMTQVQVLKQKVPSVCLGVNLGGGWLCGTKF